LHSLYGNYEKYYRRWEEDKKAQAEGQTPPVFIVVCNNTNVSKMVYDYVAGWVKRLECGSSLPLSTRPQLAGAPVGGSELPLSESESKLSHSKAGAARTPDTILVPGELPIFSNVEDAQWRSSPNTVLIDSEQLESGQAMSPEFKKIAAIEIEEFKADYRRRFPGRDTEALTDEDLLREVMNTVGKPGKLGEHVKCVVSVSMLTEGWDANAVTHILGVRAFGTQLLCEQVVGRGLRRMGYATEKQTIKVNGKQVEFEGYPTQYAEVYGVPFSFIPAAGSAKEPKPGPAPKRVRALEERAACEITFPRLTGYRFDFTEERLTAAFSEKSKLALSTADVPTKTENAPIVGEGSIHTLDDLKKHRQQEVAFRLAKVLLEEKFRDDGGNTKAWLFPQLLDISKRWLRECVVCKDNTFPQMLLLHDQAYKAVERVYTAIVASTHQDKILKPILRPFDTVGSTRYVDFDTIRDTYDTRPDKCHINRVVGDTKSWEQKLAQTLEDMNEVICYAKNDHVGFTIPYTFNGQEENYRPDFIARINDGHGLGDVLNLILEVTGAKDEKKATKVPTAEDLWIPAVNNHGGFGRWAFLEISDPWNAQDMIRKTILEC